MPAPASSPIRSPGIRRTGWLCAGFVATMVGLAYASVPLYGLFCRVTGYDGTPLVGSAPPARVLTRTVTVRLDANVAPGLDWRFAPEASELTVRLGETHTTFFRVTNAGRSAATGIATFNVQPGQAGAFFVKLQCFCFNEQTLQPGETVEFPVAFYVDPALADERSLDDLSSITLSYTYFASRNGQPVTASATTPLKPSL
jgi:cytochrome c oxidase assembly protein subunit 11